MSKAAATSHSPVTGGPSSIIVNQGILLSGGYAVAQLMSFARNACLGYGLSRDDFGIAATLTLTLQVFEILSDLAADRLIVQAKDGDEPAMLANAHFIQICRGLLIAALIAIASPLMASFFALPHLTWSFLAIAALPALKGFVHLDARRQQRLMNNRAIILIEIIPQAIVLACVIPALWWTDDFSVILYLMTVQSLMTVFMSHALAERRYKISLDPSLFKRFWSFGLPILLSALPLFAVYQGDRILVARVYGMETLATYSAAFMLTMVPGLMVFKVGTALMLPVLSRAREKGADQEPLLLMHQIIVLLACLYAAGFILLGGHILRVAFGPQYAGQHLTVSLLAIMWSLRMLQVAPGTAILASGRTTPLLIAGTLRALALLPATALALAGFSLPTIILCGIAGEFVSVGYQFHRVGFGGATNSRPKAFSSFGWVSLVIALCVLLKVGVLTTAGMLQSLTATVSVLAIIVGGCVATQPKMRKIMLAVLPDRKATGSATSTDKQPA